MDHVFVELFEKIIKVAFSLLGIYFVIAAIFSLFQGIVRATYWHEVIVGKWRTLLRLPLMISCYATIAANVRLESMMLPRVLYTHKDYSVEAVVNFFTMHNDSLIIYIRHKNPVEQDHLRAQKISKTMLQIADWAQPHTEVWGDLEQVEDREQIILAITTPADVARWGIVPVVVGMSIFTMGDAANVEDEKLC